MFSTDLSIREPISFFLAVKEAKKKNDNCKRPLKPQKKAKKKWLHTVAAAEETWVDAATVPY